MREYNKFPVLIIFAALILFISALNIVDAAVTGNNTTNNTTANLTNSVNFTGLADSDWPSYQNNNNHTGQSNYTGPQTNTTKWTYENITVYGSAVIGTDGTIYIGGYDGKLYVFSQDGIFQWTWSTRSPIMGSPTIGNDGTIYISNWMNSTIYAISSNGTLLWKYTTGDYNFGSSPVIDSDGTIYISCTNSTNGTIYAFSPAGEVKWAYTMGTIYGTSPAIGTDGTVYMADYDGVIYAINSDGTLKWSYRLRFKDNGVDYYVNIFYNSPSIGSDGTVYIANHNGRYIGPSKNVYRSEECGLFVITDNGTFATVKQSDKIAEAIYGAPAISSDGTIYLIGASKIYAMDADGKILWSYVTGGVPETGLTSAAIGSDGTIYFGSSTGVYALNHEGELKWKYITYGITDSPAISSDGILYIGTVNGTFYAFNDLGTDFTVENVKGTALTVQCTGNSTAIPSTWKWDFGDGKTSTEENPIHIYSKAGSYTITLAVTLEDGRIISRTKNVTIKAMDITTPTVNASLESGTYTSTRNVTLTATDDDNNTTIYYTTDGTDPKTSSTRNIYTGPVMINGNTTFCFAVVDSSGNWSPTYTRKFIIKNILYVQKASFYNKKTINKDIQGIIDSATSGSTVIFLGKSYEGIELAINKQLNILSTVGTQILVSSNIPVFSINGPQAAGTQISGFTILNTEDEGILVNNTLNVIISNVRVTSTDRASIQIKRSSNTSIKDSKMFNSWRGVQVEDSNNTILTGSTITGNQKDGVNIVNSTNTNIKNCTIKGNGKIYSGCGVYIESSQNTKISHSQITENWYAITTKDINWATIGHNNISGNERDGILLNGHITNTFILSNTIDANNNGIHINGPDENLTIQSNLITNSKYLEGVDHCWNGDGLLFGANSIYSNSLIVNHNIILENDHRDVETRYGSESIEDIIGSNWSGCGCGAPSHDLCGPDCQCKNWDPEMKMVITRTGEGTFTVRFYDGRNTSELITDLPSFDVTFAMNGVSQTVRTVNGEATITYNTADLIGKVIATAFERTASVSWDDPITDYVSSSDKGYAHAKAAGGDNDNGSGNTEGSGTGGSGTNTGQATSSGSTVNGVSSGTLALGAAAAASAAGSSSSQGNTDDGNSQSKTNGQSKTVQELIIDDINQNAPVWGIIAIILLVIIVCGAYYRNDIKSMIEKSKK